MGIISNRRSSFGMKCIQCSDEMIAPERSEFCNDGRARNFWYCEKCSCRFETLVSFSATTNSTKYPMTRDDNYLSLLVA